MVRHSRATPHQRRPSLRPVRALIVLGVFAAAAALILFPFDWLGNVWPAYANVFDVVFATSLSHIIGHAALFFLCGCLLLVVLPVMRSHPLRYLGVMLIGALAQESIQSLFKLQLPTAWDGRDLLLDLLRQAEEAIPSPVTTAIPRVTLVVGVNGTGKTTTVAKLAKRRHETGSSVVLAAADTFRAAAVDQLRVWADRVDAPVVHQKEGADPAAVRAAPS